MKLRRDVFQAIADPTRRAILLLLPASQSMAGTIASNFETARLTVSKHLQILIKCELLKRTTRSGNQLSIKPRQNEGNSRVHRAFSQVLGREVQ